MFAPRRQAASRRSASHARGQEEVEEIVVYGRYQDSLRRSLDRKRLSDQVIEAMSAEDIGLLSDTTIADSLARLPGLYAIKERGKE